MRLQTLAFLTLLMSGTALAQEAIETDRPDQTETATTVPAGTVQIEAGVGLERDVAEYENTFGGGTSTLTLTSISVPTVLVRVGLADGFELRVEGGAQQEESRLGSSLVDLEQTSSRSFLAAPSIGLKAELVEERGIVPQMAVIADVTIPFGNEEWYPDYAAPAVRLTMAHTLSDALTLAYNVGAEWNGVDPEGVGIYTASLGFSLGESVGAFLELFGEIASGQSPSNSFDGGLTWRPMPNLQLDIAGGAGISDSAPDVFVGAGVSVRLPQ